jgi:hypothetical protein
MKTLQHIFTAGLICGAMAFTACSDDSTSSNAEAKQQVSEKHAAFIENTRANIKTLAQNLNFASWEYANDLCTNLNKNVLLNPDFEMVIMLQAVMSIGETMTPVEEGGTLEKMGYSQYATIDISKFNYRFTVNEEEDGFDVTEADNFEMIVSGYDPVSQKTVPEMYKLSIKTEGNVGKQIIEKFTLIKGLALLVAVPEKVTYEVSVKENKKWKNIFTGKFKNTPKNSSKAEFLDMTTDSFDLEGELTSKVPYVTDEKTRIDSTTFKFKASQDGKKNTGTLTLTYEHEGKKILDVNGVMTNNNGEVDLSNFTSSNSIFDIFNVMMIGNSLDKFKITLFEDITINMKISDIEKFNTIHTASNEDRRNYSDEKTIQKYADEMNKIVTTSVESKQTDQTIDVKLVASKFGVDYWTMPALKFSDSDEYVPLFDLIDREGMIYCLNILDHAVEPLSGTLLIARQLIQYYMKLTNMFSPKG